MIHVKFFKLHLELSFSCFKLFHHDRLLAHLLDLLHHIQLFISNSIICFKNYWDLVSCCISCLVLSSLKHSNFTKLGPIFSFIDLRSARVDSFGDLNFFSLENVVVLIFFDNFFETCDNLAID